MTQSSHLGYRRWSVWLLVTANLVPVYGVLVLDWKILPVLLVFWLENVVVGVFNVLRLLSVKPFGNSLFTALFFTVHYGMFTLGHGALLLQFFGPESDGRVGLFNFELLKATVTEHHLTWAVVAITLSHGYSHLVNYLGQKEYLKYTAAQLMARPYGRVVVMHVALLVGGFVVQALGSAVYALLIFIAMKIVFDVNAHRKEHQSLEESLAVS